MSLELIKEYRIKPRTMYLDQLHELVKNDSTYEERLGFAKISSEPIILAEFRQSPGQVAVIDGRHRIVSKYRDHQQSIAAYVLPVELHLAVTTHPVYEKLFKIDWDLCCILSYMYGMSNSLSTTQKILLMK